MRRIIRKFAQNKQEDKKTNKQTEISNTEATLIPCGSSGGAGQFAENRQTNRQTDREFNYRGHSYPLWIVGVSGPIYNKGCILKPIYFRINNCSDRVFLPPVSTLSPSFYPLSFPISVSLISRSVLLDPMETVSVRLV